MIALALLSIGTLICYSGDSAWGKDTCVLELVDPAPANNWLLVQWRGEFYEQMGGQVMGFPLPAGTLKHGMGYGALIDLIQYNGETLVPKWVDVAIQPEGPVVIAPLAVSKPAVRGGWLRSVGRAFRRLGWR